MHRISYLEQEEPVDALCHHFNVLQVSLPQLSEAPATCDMPVIRDAHIPTHILSFFQPNNTNSLLAPIDAALYTSAFRSGGGFIPQSLPNAPQPIPRKSPRDPWLIVTLPVVAVTVPHVPSIALLLLFGMGLETQTNLLAMRLLPCEAVEEFPNAAAMAQVVAQLPEAQFQSHLKFTAGMWQNILCLGLSNNSLVELVQTAWNVIAEAKRIRQRNRR